MDVYNKLGPLSEKNLCKLGGVFIGDNRGKCNRINKHVEFGNHKSKSFWGDIEDETRKVFWGHIWSRA